MFIDDVIEHLPNAHICTIAPHYLRDAIIFNVIEHLPNAHICTIAPHYLRDAIIFKMGCSSDEFYDAVSRRYTEFPETEIIMPSRLPFANIAVCFSVYQEIYWFVELTNGIVPTYLNEDDFEPGQWTRTDMDGSQLDSDEIILIDGQMRVISHIEDDDFMPQFLHYFLSILSCKNIEIKRQDVPEKLNRRRVKRGKKPLFSYYTLLLKPVGKKVERSIDLGLWENRLHLVRGHSKIYTAERPLFGKLVGRYWWSPMVRGHKERGIIHKDYEIDI